MSQWSGDMSRPWWVVVTNPRRAEPEPKFHSGHETRAAAEAAAEALAAENAGAGRPAFVFAVLERPPGWVEPPQTPAGPTVAEKRRRLW